jgi:hypothetical protein
MSGDRHEVVWLRGRLSMRVASGPTGNGEEAGEAGPGTGTGGNAYGRDRHAQYQRRGYDVWRRHPSDAHRRTRRSRHTRRVDRAELEIRAPDLASGDDVIDGCHGAFVRPDDEGRVFPPEYFRITLDGDQVAMLWIFDVTFEPNGDYREDFRMGGPDEDVTNPRNGNTTTDFAKWTSCDPVTDDDEGGGICFEAAGTFDFVRYEAGGDPMFIDLENGSHHFALEITLDPNDSSTPANPSAVVTLSAWCDRGAAILRTSATATAAEIRRNRAPAGAPIRADVSYLCGDADPQVRRTAQITRPAGQYGVVHACALPGNTGRIRDHEQRRALSLESYLCSQPRRPSGLSITLERAIKKPPLRR